MTTRTRCPHGWLDSNKCESCKLKIENYMLCNLLARITRDGGHYLERHGMQKACDDADKKLVTLLSIEAAARALVKAKGRYHTEQNFKALAALFEQGEQ